MLELCERLWHLIRAHQWWHYKLSLTALAAILLSALYRSSAEHTAYCLMRLLVCGFAAGAYAAVLNDLSDLKIDAAAGKETILMSLSQKKRILLGSCILALCAFALSLLQNCPQSTFLFLSVLLVHAAYDLPPLRLKERGVLGLMAIALGEHMLPCLLSLTIVCESYGQTREIPFALVLCLSIWSLAFGLRGIIWHQLCDRTNDLNSNCRTFATQIETDKLLKFGRLIVFPAEVSAVLGVMFLIPNLPATVTLCLYLLAETYMFCFTMKPAIIVEPKPQGRFLLFDFYRLYWPLSILASSAALETNYWWLAGAYTVCFAAPLIVAGRRLSLYFSRSIKACYSKLRPSSTTGIIVSDFEALYERQVRSPNQNVHDKPQTTQKPLINAALLNNSIDRAIAFLGESQLPSGGFKSWLVPHQSTGLSPIPDSSPFPAALIAHCLGLVDTAAAGEIHRRTAHFLINEMEECGAWRYFASDHPRFQECPLDLDDTSLAASVVLPEIADQKKTRALMLANRNRQGLFYTWLIPRPGQVFHMPSLKLAGQELRHRERLQNFFQLNEAEPDDIDAVVNANVLYLFGRCKDTDAVVDFITQVVRGGREESSDKWHHSRFNLYYAMSKSMHRDKLLFQDLNSLILSKIRKHTAQSGLIGKHVLDTALAVSSLLNMQAEQSLEKSIEFILENQMQSGAWKMLPLYYGGPTEGCSFGSEEITTAFCLEALHRFARLNKVPLSESSATARRLS